MEVTGIHVPIAGATGVHNFCPGSIGNKIVVVRVLDAPIAAGTEEVGLGKTRTKCWGWSWAQRWEGSGVNFKTETRSRLLWYVYEFTRQAKWGQPNIPNRRNITEEVCGLS